MAESRDKRGTTPAGPGGFIDPARADSALASLAAVGGSDFAARADAAARAAADPDRALDGLERFAAARPRLARADAPPWLETAATLCGASELFLRVLARRPRLLDWLLATPHRFKEKTVDELTAELGGRVRTLAPDDLAGLMRLMRRFKYRELMRIALRDLSGASRMPEVGREVSHLAEALLSRAVPFLDRLLRARHGDPEGAPPPGHGFAVLGMGKLGGQELNYSSDVDLVFVYGKDGRTSGGPGGSVTHLELYARLGELLTKAMGEVTEDGFAFRVDLNLRPEGRNGPIACSVDAMEQYYESYGRTWERAALVKARPVAGERAIGDSLLSALAPFVWRRSVDHTAVEEMRAIKAQIDRRAGARADDLKLGKGGIREIEFFVQALQLLHGGRDGRLRERSTLAALSKEFFAGLVTGRDHDALADAYVFLRNAEHRVQIFAERQTHALPEDAPGRARVARAMGFSAAGPFEEALGRHRAVVGAIFADILAATGAAPTPADPLLACAVDPDAPEPERLAALGAEGFAAPAEALRALGRLARHGDSPFARRGGPSADAMRLVSDCAAAPDPDLALFHLAEMFAALRSPSPYYRLLAEHPPTARLLASLFGSSEFLSRYFLRHPELLDLLVRSDQAVATKGRLRLSAELAERLLPLGDLEGRLGAMRRFKNEEVLRIGLSDVAGASGLDEVGGELSDLADVLLAACLELCLAEATSRFGLPRGPSGETSTLAVLGLGKLGGRELGYHSDLDLIFVYSHPGETTGGERGRSTNAEFFARVAHRLLSHLSIQLREGSLYRTDVQLRPSGNQGTLVVSATAFAEHQAERAQVWERQALTKARLVGGDPALFDRLEREVVAPWVFRPCGDPASLRAEIQRMRTRMEVERAQETRERYHPKLGRGGLADVEFVAQYLELVHGAAHPEVREPNTRRAIAALARVGALAPADAELLDGAYLFLRRLENRLRIVRDHPIQHLPREGRALEGLARRMGLSGQAPGAALLGQYEALTAEVRALYDRVLGGDA